jgi:hypothetical protein
MEYPFPPEFPQQLRNLILAESIRAARDFERVKQDTHSRSAIEGLLRNYILRGFIVFVREAAELGRQGIWTAARVESESLEFLRRCTILARQEEGYDSSGNQLGEMVSHWNGRILPEVQRGFRQSPEWQEYEDILLAVADAPAGLRKDQSQLAPAATAVPVGVGKFPKIPQDAPCGGPRAIASIASPNLAHIELREEQGVVRKMLSAGLRRKPVRRSPKYEAIDRTLRCIAESRPTSHEEVFRALDGRIPIPNAVPIGGAGGWLAGFRRNKIAARTWLSKAWSHLSLPAFPRGPK